MTILLGQPLCASAAAAIAAASSFDKKLSPVLRVGWKPQKKQKSAGRLDAGCGLRMMTLRALGAMAFQGSMQRTLNRSSWLARFSGTGLGGTALEGGPAALGLLQCWVALPVWLSYHMTQADSMAFGTALIEPHGSQWPARYLVP